MVGALITQWLVFTGGDAHCRAGVTPRLYWSPRAGFLDGSDISEGKEQPACLGVGRGLQQDSLSTAQHRVSARPPLPSGRRKNNRKREELTQTKDKQTSEIGKAKVAN